jgi:putative PEP-CTERM system histidine kinase
MHMSVVVPSLSALVCLFGGVLILMRSGASAGRAIACGLLALTAVQVCSVVLLCNGIATTAASVSSLFELMVVCCLTVAMVLVERGISSRPSVVIAVVYGLAGLCFLYGGALLLAGRYGFAVPVQGRVLALGGIGKAHAVLLLLCCIGAIWMVENILRSFRGADRSAIRFPAAGLLSILGAMCLLAVHRLSTSIVGMDVIMLSALMVCVGAAMLIFFSIRYRLFDLDVFVSRYVVYHSVTFVGIGLYLVLTGMVLVGIRHLGLRAPFVVTGFVAFVALAVLFVMSLSGEARSRLRFFIDTHFFANKYDYRKEWTELSGFLTIAHTERQIVHVTAQVVLDSMYSRDLSIWLKRQGAFSPAISFPGDTLDVAIDETHPLVVHLEKRSYFMRRAPSDRMDEPWERIVSDHQGLLDENRIELAVGMFAGKDLIGFITVGKEMPGTTYGRDDVDLLTAIASQASSALAKAWFAQRLAENKELDTYNRMSASLLHDLKNAAAHLSLILQNAPRHMDREEFRLDMLDTIGQALARIDKVIGKLGVGDKTDEVKTSVFKAQGFLDGLLSRMRPRFKGIDVSTEIDDTLEVETDPDILERILENIVVNAVEAVDGSGRIVVGARKEGPAAYLWVSDDGPGMSDDFMRDRLFRPFQTTKTRGTGLGLWHVKQMADKIGATIDVRPNQYRGMTFAVKLRAGAEGGGKPPLAGG